MGSKESCVKVEEKALKQEEGTKKKVTKKPKRTINRSSWNDRVAQCKQFREKNNHLRIPTNFKEDKSLGIWVQEVRRNFKALMTGGKPRRSLSPDQIEELDKLGFYWGKFEVDRNKIPEPDSMWETNFANLAEYKKSHGDFNVPIDDKNQKALYQLGIWVRVQRTQKYYRDTKRKCFITKDRVKRLSDVGFDWKGERKLSP